MNKIEDLLHVLAFATADYIAASSAQEYAIRHQHGVGVMHPPDSWGAAFDAFCKAQTDIIVAYQAALDSDCNYSI